MTDWHGGLALKSRQLLALLLTVGRDGISSERAAHFLWGGDQPASAPQMVRCHVMKLRSTLGRNRQWIKHCGATGYRLEARDGEVDAWVFERLLHQAQRSLDRGAPAKALQHLEAATALWRGDFALRDVCTIVELEAEAARLEELKSQAEELAIEAHLLQGNAHGIIPRLMSLVIRHPLREVFLRQLMLALSATGRHIEAAATYQKARKQFIEQVGMEPSTATARVHEGILQGEHWRKLMPRPLTSVLSAEFDTYPGIPFARAS
ncbi:AfsR/SARP family transcriptional regulator [Streptomyces decoyicus]